MTINLFALLFTFIIGIFLFGMPLRIVLRKRIMLGWAKDMPLNIGKLTSIATDCKKNKSYPSASDMIYLVQLAQQLDLHVLCNYWASDTWKEGNFFGLFRYDLTPLIKSVSLFKDKSTNICCAMSNLENKAYFSYKTKDVGDFIDALFDCLTNALAVCTDYEPIVRKEIRFWSVVSGIGLLTTLFIGASLVQ